MNENGEYDEDAVELLRDNGLAVVLRFNLHYERSTQLNFDGVFLFKTIQEQNSNQLAVYNVGKLILEAAEQLILKRSNEGKRPKKVSRRSNRNVR